MSLPMRAKGQKGFLLVGLVTMMSVMAITSGVLVQEWSIIEKRDNEAELIFIQEQYAAAIIAYQLDQGRFPQSLDELDERGQKNQRFIRKLFVDPMTPGAKPEDWCLLHVNAGGQVTSSCSSQDRGLGLDAPIGRIGQGGTGNQPRQPRQPGQAGQPSPLQGLTPGAKAIVGVHSRSHDSAFNTVKRGEMTYNRWFYTFEDYQREAAARNIPGLEQGKGPGGAGQGPGPGGVGTTPSGLQPSEDAPSGRRRQRRQRQN